MEQEGLPRSQPKTVFMHVLEPTLLIAAITGIVYLIGQTYYRAYYSRLGLPIEQVVLSTETILARGFNNAIVIAGIGAVYFLFRGGASKRAIRTAEDLLIGLGLIMIALAGTPIWFWHGIPVPLLRSGWAAAIMAILVAVWMVIDAFQGRESFRSAINKQLKRGHLMVGVAVALVFVALSSGAHAALWGARDAAHDVQSSTCPGMTLFVHMKAPPENVSEQPRRLCFVDHREGHFIAVDIGARFHPVHFIPDSEISEAVIVSETERPPWPER